MYVDKTTPTAHTHLPWMYIRSIDNSLSQFVNIPESDGFWVSQTCCKHLCKNGHGKRRGGDSRTNGIPISSILILGSGEMTERAA